MAHRVAQVGVLLQELTAAYLESHLEMRGVLVTVTNVEVSHDLSSAKLLISVLPEGSRGSALQALRRLLPGLKKDLRHKTALRIVPKLDFAIDNRAARAAELDQLLDEVLH